MCLSFSIEELSRSLQKEDCQEERHRDTERSLQSVSQAVVKLVRHRGHRDRGHRGHRYIGHRDAEVTETQKSQRSHRQVTEVTET